MLSPLLKCKCRTQCKIASYAQNNVYPLEELNPIKELSHDGIGNEKEIILLSLELSYVSCYLPGAYSIKDFSNLILVSVQYSVNAGKIELKMFVLAEGMSM